MIFINYLKEFPIAFHIFLLLSFISFVPASDDAKLSENPLSWTSSRSKNFLIALKYKWNNIFYILFLAACVLVSIFTHWYYGIFLFIEAYLISAIILGLVKGLFKTDFRVVNFFSDLRLYLMISDIYLIYVVVKIIIK